MWKLQIRGVAKNHVKRIKCNPNINYWNLISMYINVYGLFILQTPPKSWLLFLTWFWPSSTSIHNLNIYIFSFNPKKKKRRVKKMKHIHSLRFHTWFFVIIVFLVLSHGGSLHPHHCKGFIFIAYSLYPCALGVLWLLFSL